VRIIAVAGFMFYLAPALALGKDNPTPAGGVAWIYGDSEAEVDAVFARAKSAATPVLLYWGAIWCPPCNQLKATLFNRRDFIALTRAVLPVYLDGDLPGAQKQGSRFKVVGYPTLILFAPDGVELTRLPGESDAVQVIAAMKAALTGGRPAASILADARAGRPVSASEWMGLAFYSWETDEARLVERAQRAAVLADLANRAQAVSPEASSRLWLKSLAVRDATAVAGATAPAATPEQRERLLGVLRSSGATRLNADVIIEGARPIVRALSVSADSTRAQLLDEYAAALLRLQNDAQLSRADRTNALIARVDLARIESADDAVTVSLPLPLLTEVRTLARRMDAETSNGFERQAVITGVADLLGEAGLWAESDALLKANLKKSHAPYYLMSQLGGNARKLGRKAEALDWYERAYRTSKGPATRLQWGASYVAALVDLAPEQGKRIEQAVTDLFADAKKDKGAFYERSGRSLRRATGKISAWNTSGAHAAELERLHLRHREVCTGIAVADPQHALCEALWPDVRSDVAALQ
jgi:tetratricopeptide (TPR) repeat protein